MTVEELLEKARNESTNSKSLLEIWNSTTSTRVRKAVASNPNLDCKLFPMACRLYVKEVVNNPSFEMLKVFLQDPVVEQIYNCYKDPQSVKNILSVRDESLRNSLAKAMLISPNLKNISLLESPIFHVLTKQELEREFKDKSVKANVRKLFEKEYDTITNSFLRGSRSSKRLRLPTLTTSVRMGVLSLNEMGHFLLQISPGMYFSPYKSFLNLVTQALNSGNYELLFRILSFHSTYSLKKLTDGMIKEDLKLSDEVFTSWGEIYKDMLVCESLNPVREKPESTWNSDSHSKCVSDLLWHQVIRRNLRDGQTLENVDLVSLYQDLKLIGFDKDFGPYNTPIVFTNWSEEKQCEKLLEIGDDQVFEYFMTSGMFNRKWHARSYKDNPESKLVDRIEKINYSRGFKYYNRVNLDAYPYINIWKFHGLGHNPQSYTARGVPPSPTGKISDETYTWLGISARPLVAYAV
jgi:hypothetical protein